jgi:DNA-binding response OmpR family regulator
MSLIMLINGESAVREMVQSSLPDSYRLLHTDTIQSALFQTRRESPDLIVVDATRPDHDGLEACHELRGMSNTAWTPILVLVSNRTAQEVAHLLDAGADDCLRKPLAPRELAARLRALLRRTHRPRFEALITLNPLEKTVHVGGRLVELTSTEYDLLEALCESPGQHLATTTLLERVWHYPPGTGDPALVRNHVRNLRRKLENDPERPRVITCYQGRGYTVSAKIQKSASPQVS